MEWVKQTAKSQDSYIHSKTIAKIVTVTPAI